MSAQLRPIATTAPQRPDADAIRTELLADINSRFLDLTSKQSEWQSHSLRAERWRATALAGVGGLLVGAAFVWLIYSGAALTGGAIANTDRNLDRLEAATNDLKR